VYLSGTGATLFANNQFKATFDYGETLTSGEIGLGSSNAVTIFDDFSLAEGVAPATGTTLPHTDDFSDGEADFFSPQLGTWRITGGGRYRGEAAAGGDAISLLQTAATLPANYQFDAVMRSKISGAKQNMYMIFDYQGPTDFKYAGAAMGSGKWKIGHCDGTSWPADATFSETITSNVDYNASLQIVGTTATLLIGGVEKVSFDFGVSLNSGQVGFGTHNAHAIFDDLAVDTLATGASLPHTEDFGDGVANFFSVVAGTWVVNFNDRYEAASGSDAISLIAVDGTLPGDTHIVSVIRAKGTGPSYNGYILFDYQGAADFKFAGVDVDAGAWVLGHRDGTGWQIDASVAGSVSDKVDYEVAVYLSGTEATLFADSQFKATFDYGETLTSGEVGLGSSNAVTIFDDFSLAEGAAPSGEPSASTSSLLASAATAGETTSDDSVSAIANVLEEVAASASPLQ